MQVNLDYLRTPSGLLKLAEIVLVLVAVIIFRGFDTFFNGTLDSYTFGGGVLVMGLIITPLLLVCYLMGRVEIQKTIFEMVFNCLMFVFLLTVGILPLAFWSNRLDLSGANQKSKGKALGSFCILASLAYLADTVFAFLLYRQ